MAYKFNIGQRVWWNIRNFTAIKSGIIVRQQSDGYYLIRDDKIGTLFAREESELYLSKVKLLKSWKK